MNKLIWHSNAPHSPTGYGQQTALFAPGIAKHYDLAISSFYGLESAPIVWKGIPVFPGLGGQFGDDMLIKHAEQFFGGNAKDGLVVTLMDVWVLNPAFMRKMNTAAWVPVDHEPAPQGVLDYFLNSGAVPIAMSRFGERMLGRIDPLYVPHAVDCEKYKPFDRRAIRKEVGLPEDTFIVGMVAANKGRPSRKCFSQALQAFARLREKHENAVLYLHTVMNPSYGEGEDLAALLEDLGVPQDCVRIADQYRMLVNPYSEASMAKIYNCFDVLLNPAMGEGFGVPQLEAQACGVPVICTDFSAMPEVVGAGWHVKVAQKYWTGLKSWQAIPDVDDIVSALEECYAMTKQQRAKMSTGARQHALGYALPKVMKQYMLPALKKAEQRFANQQPVTIAPRRRELKAAA